MNFQQIRAFHLVAQEGSVRQAAEVLAVSQPTVSQHLKKLEERHGFRLFDRQGRGLVMTEAGAELFGVTKRLLDTASEVEDLLQRRHRQASGHLRIVSDSPAIAVRIVQTLLVEHPDIEISIRKDSVAGIVTAITEVSADVGIAVEAPIGSPLLVTPLRREELLVCLPVSSEVAREPQFQMSWLADQTLLQREKGSRTRALLERAMAVERVVPARVIEVEGADIIREAVARSLGVSFIAESECPPDPRIAYRRVATHRGQIGFVENLIIRRDRRRIPEIAAFLRAAEHEKA